MKTCFSTFLWECLSLRFAFLLSCFYNCFSNYSPASRKNSTVDQSIGNLYKKTSHRIDFRSIRNEREAWVFQCHILHCFIPLKEQYNVFRCNLFFPPLSHRKVFRFPFSFRYLLHFHSFDVICLSFSPFFFFFSFFL